MISHLEQKGVECRPIVAGNFAKNEVLKWFDYEIEGSLHNAEAVDSQGFFVGNHQVPFMEQIKNLKNIFNEVF